ncbi:hypothetical protein [Bosea sp. PAMC 26642]|uniref:hypothetical protein n=1 Tax=Bosea sp. (strain PAMC 26642) TaxID=1792307 RepID=UPI0007701F96|nr:hypothetical protein [Bosea sp. PAMC 26642]AMJ60799.1 hypothetical protein AXW83_11295 [Bosea sp. PAMC 26642]
MSEPDESEAGGEPIDAEDAVYLRLVESLFCEWRSAADAAAYDDLLDRQTSVTPAPSSRA